MSYKPFYLLAQHQFGCLDVEFGCLAPSGNVAAPTGRDPTVRAECLHGGFLAAANLAHMKRFSVLSFWIKQIASPGIPVL